MAKQMRNTTRPTDKAKTKKEQLALTKGRGTKIIKKVVKDLMPYRPQS